MLKRLLPGLGLSAALVLGSVPVTAAATREVTSGVTSRVVPGVVSHPGPVSDDPGDWTPQLVYSGTGPRPHVDALASSGGTVYAGGSFDAVERHGRTYRRTNLVALDSSSGQVNDFAPVVDDTVWAVEATADAVYVGGEFRTVNGVSRPALVKLNLDGTVDRSFDPGFQGGRIDEIDLVGGRLIVGGRTGRKLMALDPRTGHDTRYLRLTFADKLPNSWGAVAIYQFDVSPDGRHLIATGNFQTVNGKPRARFVMVNLRPARARLVPWYYDGFAKKCTATAPRRIAYLQGVDYAPSGQWFVVTATGQVPRKGDRDVTVCDAAARFDVDDKTAPRWINYTGGDSVWSAEVTGSTVYVQGHFKWLDNRDGYASRCPNMCARRRGVGAIAAGSGRALAWDPDKPARIGGKTFLATAAGLWIGSDSVKVHREPHRGLAFMPLP